MIEILDKKQCCGCTACANICTHNAISMKSDTLGFLYPVVDKTLCVECGLCEKVCQFHDKYERYGNFETPLVYGCRHKDANELQLSQSGAASWALMEIFMSSPGGIVYGVGFDTVTHVVHKRAATLEDCQEFRNSKYVQSDITGVFPLVKKDLMEGKRVLFTGTACQVAGLKSYIPNRLLDNLYTMDIVCHATPSPAIWKGYVEFMEKRFHSKVIKVYFRDKRFGWHSHNETFFFANGKQKTKAIMQKLFYDHVIIRRSCSNCHFTNLHRVSDLTVSDYWGWEKHYKEWNDNKGVSLLLVNSEKGKILFNSLQEKIDYIESDKTKCLQPQLIGPSTIGEKIDEVEAVFSKKGFHGVAIMYNFAGIRYQINRVKAVFNLIAKKIIR